MRVAAEISAVAVWGYESELVQYQYDLMQCNTSDAFVVVRCTKSLEVVYCSADLRVFRLSVPRG